MKNTIFIASIIGALVLTSCNKDDNMDTTINVNYPAAYVVNGEDATVSVIKLSTNEVMATIPLMGTGTDMIMSSSHFITRKSFSNWCARNGFKCWTLWINDCRNDR